jgi:prepilin-type N-terminal cleavage/methylation domain-containing protein
MLRSRIGNGLLRFASPRRGRGASPRYSFARGANSRQSRGLMGELVGIASCKRGAFTLIEMLVAMAITLVMMGAVVTLFANISNSVRNRRATTEMSGQLRHVRNVLQQDLQGATCPGVTWQRPESNHGYIEIIEGQYREGYATNLLDADTTKPSTWPPTALNPEIDHAVSTLPSSNVLPFKDATWATDGAGLGDADDVLMLTSRNEREPFVGRTPSKVRPDNQKADTFDRWESDTIQSPLAEVVWFANENPGHTDAASSDPDPTGKHFFGEPGFRTIYRRTLLIAPWLNPYRFTDSNGNVTDTFTYGGVAFKAEPGLLRILPEKLELEQAIASIIAFQDRYDISARLEWDANMDGGKGRWKIMANTLGDLTKRENRFCHFGYLYGPSSAIPPSRRFPFWSVSMGQYYRSGTVSVAFAGDPEIASPSTKARATGYVTTLGAAAGCVGAYGVDDVSSGYKARPFVYVAERSQAPGFDTAWAPATAQAILNDDGLVVRVVHGPAPLWGSRRGEDVMMTDVLAFDLRVYDPGAPMFGTIRKAATSSTPVEYDVVLTPSDPGWRGSAPNGSDGAYMNDPDNMGSTNGIGNRSTTYAYLGQGAYVDMGYGYDPRFQLTGQPLGMFPAPKYASNYASGVAPWFFDPHGLSDVFGHQVSPGYCVYDTWSFHYENDGIDEDGSTVIFPGTVDQGTNGLDDRDFRTHAPTDGFDPGDFAINGIDDVGERETAPPYDKPLRGMQAVIRTYEHDSRAIRQVRVNQHFMAE